MLKHTVPAFEQKIIALSWHFYCAALISWDLYGVDSTDLPRLHIVWRIYSIDVTRQTHEIDTAYTYLSIRRSTPPYPKNLN